MANSDVGRISPGVDRSWEIATYAAPFWTGPATGILCRWAPLAKRHDIHEEERNLPHARIFWTTGGHRARATPDRCGTGRFGDHEHRVWKPSVAVNGGAAGAGPSCRYILLAATGHPHRPCRCTRLNSP